MIGVINKNVFKSIESGRSKNLSRLAGGISHFSKRTVKCSDNIEVNSKNTLIKHLSLHRRTLPKEMNDLY